MTRIRIGSTGCGDIEPSILVGMAYFGAFLLPIFDAVLNYTERVYPKILALEPVGCNNDSTLKGFGKI